MKIWVNLENKLLFSTLQNRSYFFKTKLAVGPISFGVLNSIK
jgi:hypothetical protein